ncbi:hypothetical protein [Cryptosporangium aurantiacum]|uniref:hypothetical protein n=1 Tax=Cryptosporangium aurantiacum TaxID=134849 RepID=UPI001161167F|nr:hypothetical protein [Cryptosporangium aurantiacum]
MAQHCDPPTAARGVRSLRLAEVSGTAARWRFAAGYARAALLPPDRALVPSRLLASAGLTAVSACVAAVIYLQNRYPAADAHLGSGDVLFLGGLLLLTIRPPRSITTSGPPVASASAGRDLGCRNDGRDPVQGGWGSIRRRDPHGPASAADHRAIPEGGGGAGRDVDAGGDRDGFLECGGDARAVVMPVRW